MERAIIYCAKTGLEATDHFVPELLEKGNITLEILFMESKGRLLIPGERMLKQMHQHGSE